MNRYNHYDRMQISISESLSLMQSMQNANTRNMCKALINRAGFIGDSFKVAVASDVGVTVAGAAIVMSSGVIIFPNGEVFYGDGSSVRMSLERSAGYQYLVASYQPLRQTKLTAADSGFADNTTCYGYRRDGVRLSIIPEAEFTSIGINDLMVCRIEYLTSGGLPVIEDERQYASLYFGTDVLDSDYSLEPETLETHYHEILPGGDVVSGVLSNLVWSPLYYSSPIGLRYTMQTAIPQNQPKFVWIANEKAVWSRHSNRLCRYRPVAPGYKWFTHNVPGAILGVTTHLADRNVPAVQTDPSSASEQIIGNTETDEDVWLLSPDIHINVPFDTDTILMRSYVDPADFSDATEDRAYIQTWAKDSYDVPSLDPHIDPVSFEMPLALGTSDAAMASIPHNIYIPVATSRYALVASRIIWPGQLCGPIAYTRLHRSNIMRIVLNIGIDFPSYVPNTAGDDWFKYATDPGVDTHTTYQYWWDSSVTSYEVASFRAPGGGWYLKKAHFRNDYLIAAAPPPTGTLMLTGGTTDFSLDISNGIDGDSPYTSLWDSTTSLPIPLTEDQRIGFELTVDAPDTYILVCGQLVFELEAQA